MKEVTLALYHQNFCKSTFSLIILLFVRQEGLKETYFILLKKKSNVTYNIWSAIQIRQNTHSNS